MQTNEEGLQGCHPEEMHFHGQLRMLAKESFFAEALDVVFSKMLDGTMEQFHMAPGSLDDIGDCVPTSVIQVISEFLYGNKKNPARAFSSKHKCANIVLSEGNGVAERTGGGNNRWGTVTDEVVMMEGLHYWELEIMNFGFSKYDDWYCSLRL